MEDIVRIYSLTPPGLMRPDFDEGKNMQGGNEQLPIAMAYVPRQNWQKIYEKDKGFMRGTIFEELDKTFKGAKR